jgi:hypothetical protein
VFEKLKLKRKGKASQGLVTRSKKRGGERGPEGSRTTVHYDITVKMKFESGEEVERDFTLGNLFTGTSLSPAVGELVPVLYDPDDHSNFVVDEGKMVDEQKAWLNRKKRESDDFDRRAAEEAEDRLPPTPG